MDEKQHDKGQDQKDVQIGQVFLLKEVEEVLISLNQMKEALKESLYRQWNLEKSREEQITALAHDIKTPLTVIRGNAISYFTIHISWESSAINR